MKPKNVLVVTSRQKDGALDAVKKVLEGYKINFNVKKRDFINKRDFENHKNRRAVFRTQGSTASGAPEIPKGFLSVPETGAVSVHKDLVIAVGGDGTFLRASHFIKDKTLLLGVNSNKKQKEGFFMQCDEMDFENKFKKILKNRFKTINLTRLEASINNKKIGDLALNEIYIGAKKAYQTSRYVLQLKNKKEEQKSSGIIIGTAAGSNAWLASAGGKKLPLSSKKIQLIVREPYYGKLTKPKLTKKILPENAVIKIKSKMQGIVVIDSLSKEYMFKFDDTITIKKSNKELRYVLV